MTKLIVWLICKVRGHERVRVFTDVELVSATTDGIEFRAFSSRWDCVRCGKTGIAT